MLKLRSTGRGRNYTRFRGLTESIERLAYAGSWPSRLWSRVPAANRVAVREHRLQLRPAGSGRPPLRLAFASDLHIGPLTPRPLLDNAFRLLAEAAPDLLVLGGDYVSYEATPDRVAQLERLVRRVSAPAKVAVLGNHDLWTAHDRVEAALARAGARVLVNDSLRLPPPHDDVGLVGVDDAFAGVIDAERAFAAPPAPVQIVVSHTPDGFPAVVGRRADLLLCGHTHGGQVALPWAPIVMHGRYGKRWHAGLHRTGDLQVFVSRGLGMTDLPVRAFASPEVAVFHIE